MSFLSKLHQVGNVAGSIAHIVSPVVGVLVPGSTPLFALADVVLTRIQDSVVLQEAKDPTSGHGARKLQNATADVVNSLQTAQDDAAESGLHLDYDIALLQSAISAQVAFLNAVAAFKGSFKTTPLAP